MKADTEPQYAGERRESQHAGPRAALLIPTAALRLHGQPQPAGGEYTCRGLEQGSRSRGARERQRWRAPLGRAMSQDSPQTLQIQILFPHMVPQMGGVVRSVFSDLLTPTLGL